MSAPTLTLAAQLLVTITVFAPVAAGAQAIEKTAMLDAIVTGPDGNAPPSLAPAVLSLKIGGRQQTIRSVQMVVPSAETPRYILLLVDEATLYALEPIVKDALATLLSSLKPTDLVSFASTRRAAARTEMTARRQPVTAAVNAMVTGPGALYPCQRDLTKVLATSAAGLPRGRSTSVVVISRGHPEFTPTSEADDDPCAPRREDLRALEEAIAVAQVNLHLFTVSDAQRSWAFDTIAANVGATSGLLTWADHSALARTIQSTATYYRVTFDWNAPSVRAQRVELRSKDKSLKMRTSTWLRPN